MYGQKHSVCGCRDSGILTISLPQTACSAILHGFDRCSRDRKPLFSVIFFHAEAVDFQPWQTHYKTYKKEAGGSGRTGKSTLFAAAAIAAFLQFLCRKQRAVQSCTVLTGAVATGSLFFLLFFYDALTPDFSTKTVFCQF